MPRYKDTFQRYLEAVQKTGDIMLRLQYQHDMMLDDIYAKKEREQLVRDVADEVISRLNITVDATDIINQIEELKKIIDSLGGK